MEQKQELNRDSQAGSAGGFSVMRAIDAGFTNPSLKAA